MRVRMQSGFTLLEVLVALVLFAAVLLSILATGQLILARLFDADLRLRSAIYAQSVADSLRSTACSRVSSGAASLSRLAATWLATDTLDIVRVDIAVSAPQRGGAPRAQRISALFSCPEP